MRRVVFALTVLVPLVFACEEEVMHPFPDMGGSAGKQVSIAGGSSAGGSSAASSPGGISTTGSAGGISVSTSGGKAPVESESSSGGDKDQNRTGGRAATLAGGAPDTADGGTGESASGGSEPELQDHFRLVVIGSSTSAGEGASSAAKGWVGLLTTALDASIATDFACTNLSMSGYSSESLMPEGSAGNIDDAIASNPDLIVVALAGSNDLSLGTSKSTFFSRLSQVRERAEARGIPVFFLTTAPKDLSDEERETLKEWAVSIEEELGVCWVPAEERHSPCVIDVFDPLANSSFGVRSEFGAGDGIHLNDAGHREIFRVAEAVIGPYACSVTRCK
jgi:lysophospholipase L1-like esterase